MNDFDMMGLGGFVASLLLGGWVGAARGRAGLGFALGGIVGGIVAAIMVPMALSIALERVLIGEPVRSNSVQAARLVPLLVPPVAGLFVVALFVAVLPVGAAKASRTTNLRPPKDAASQEMARRNTPPPPPLPLRQRQASEQTEPMTASPKVFLSPERMAEIEAEERFRAEVRARIARGE